MAGGGVSAVAGAHGAPPWDAGPVPPGLESAGAQFASAEAWGDGRGGTRGDGRWPQLIGAVLHGRAAWALAAVAVLAIGIVGWLSLGGSGPDDVQTPMPGSSECTRITGDELLTVLNAGVQTPATLRSTSTAGTQDAEPLRGTTGASACRYQLEAADGRVQSVVIGYATDGAATVRDAMAARYTSQTGVAATPVSGGEEAYVYELIVSGVRVPRAAWVRRGDTSAILVLEGGPALAVTDARPSTEAVAGAAQLRGAVLQLITILGQRA